MAEFAIQYAEPDEAHTLRNFLLMNCPDGMPEDVVAFPLQATLTGLHYIQTTFGREPAVDSGRICFFVDDFEHAAEFLLAFDLEQMEMVGPALNPLVGVWGVGILALEMAYGYGSLPENMTPLQLLTLGDNMVRILRPKLGGNRKKKIKKLPNSLEMLLNGWYVNRREQKLIAKRNARGIMRAIRIVESSFRSLATTDTHEKISFSRNFLEVVLRCLDRDHPTPIPHILDLPFFKNVEPRVVEALI